MLTIKVLGPGCQNCVRVEEIARRAVSNLGLEAQIIKVTNYNEIKAYPILATPGLVVNEKLICAGRIPEDGEVVAWLVEASETA